MSSADSGTKTGGGRALSPRTGRTVSEADNILFSTLTMNPQALHLDEAWAAQQPFGQRLVNSLFTLSTLVASRSRS